MKARANAVQELEAAGTFGDFTALGTGEDDIDRQLRELSSTSAVDSELEKMKAELGTGGSSAPALSAGSEAPPAAEDVTPEATVEPEASDSGTDTAPAFEESGS
jgi:phage shock protein A